MAKSGAKGRKIGRNAAKCKRYRDCLTREKNKKRDLKKHIKRQPNDACAVAALGRM